MPLAKIYLLEVQYDEARMNGVSVAVQEALISVLKDPSDDCFQIIHVLPRSRFRHTPSFLGLKYSDDLIVLEPYRQHRPRDQRRERTAERARHCHGQSGLHLGAASAENSGTYPHRSGARGPHSRGRDDRHGANRWAQISSTE
jgi:hypothetical protein